MTTWQNELRQPLDICCSAGAGVTCVLRGTGNTCSLVCLSALPHARLSFGLPACSFVCRPARLSAHPFVVLPVFFLPVGLHIGLPARHIHMYTCRWPAAPHSCPAEDGEGHRTSHGCSTFPDLVFTRSFHFFFSILQHFELMSLRGKWLRVTAL